MEDEEKMYQILEAIFSSYDIEFENHEGWLAPYGELPAIKATWYPEATATVGQLSIEVFIDDGVSLVESFAGYGEKKLESALGGFIKNSLPLLLSAFWDYDTNVSSENWEINGVKYQAFIGDYGVINGAENFEIPEHYLEYIHEAMLKEKLSSEYHWFNLFYVNFDATQHHAEALRDNSKWEEGTEIIRSLPWSKVYDYYSIRQFIILKRA